GDVSVSVPDYMAEVVATFSHLARQSPHVNQRSGVSVRLSVANFETLCANAIRRAVRLGERHVVPRVSDLDALAASTSGKVEIESIEDGREGQIIESLLKASVLQVFRARVAPEQLRNVLNAFDEGVIAHTGDDLPASEEAALIDTIPPLRDVVRELTGDADDPASVASAVEFVLEGLHLSKRLNKDGLGARSTYRARG
ncbi:MAG: magnesium chelatase, partial [Acidimicrobiia bacterium]